MEGGRVTVMVSPWVSEDQVKNKLAELGFFRVSLAEGMLEVHLELEQAHLDNRVRQRLEQFERPLYEHVVELKVPEPMAFISGLVDELEVEFCRLPDGKFWFGSNSREDLAYVLNEIGLQLAS